MPKKILLLPFFAIMLLLLQSCSVEVTKENIVGKWKVIRVQPYVEDIKEETLMEVKKTYLITSIEFFDTDSYKVTTEDNSYTEEGKWKLDKEYNLIIMDPDKKRQNTQAEVESLYSSQMIWKEEVGGLGYIKLTLERE